MSLLLLLHLLCSFLRALLRCCPTGKCSRPLTPSHPLSHFLAHSPACRLLLLLLLRLRVLACVLACAGMTDAGKQRTPDFLSDLLGVPRAPPPSEVNLKSLLGAEAAQ